MSGRGKFNPFAALCSEPMVSFSKRPLCNLDPLSPGNCDPPGEQDMASPCVGAQSQTRSTCKRVGAM